MENSAKEKRQYIIINALLISIVLLLGIYIYKVIQSNKQQIKLGYEHGVNVVQQLQDEYINVEKIDGSDRYFYTEDTIFLSKDIYEGKSIYDVAVSSYLVSSFIKNNESKDLIRVLSILFSFRLLINSSF